MLTDFSSRNADPEPPPRRGRLRLLAVTSGILLVGFLLLVLLLYVERQTIAAYVVERYLAGIGVGSDIEFEALSFGAFTARAKIAAGEKPDFSTESVEAVLVYPAGFGFPTIASVRFVRPYLLVTHDGEKFSFGTLQPLIDALAKGSGGPGPTVAIEEGTLLISTSYGALQFTGNANIENGRVENLDAKLQKTTLRGNGFLAEITGGTVTASTVGDLMQATLHVSADGVNHDQDSAHGVDVSLGIRGLQWGNVRGVINFAFSGATLSVTAADVSVRQTSATKPTAVFDFGVARGTLQDGRLRATSPVRMTGTGSGLTFATRDGQAAIATMSVQLTSESGSAEYAPGAWSISGPVHAAADGAGIKIPLRGGAAGGSLHGEFDGQQKLGSGGAEGTLKVSFSGNAGVPAAAARELARIPGDAAMTAAITSALRNVALQVREASIASDRTETAFALATPMTLTGAGGAKLSLSTQGTLPFLRMRGDELAGAFSLETTGGGLPDIRFRVPAYRSTPDTLTATTEFDARFIYAGMRGVHATGSGTLRSDHTRTVFELARCADISLDSYGNGNAPFVRNAKGQLCADAGRTTFVSQPSGWQVQGRIAGASVTIELLQSEISNGQGRIQFAGNANGIQSLRLDMGQAVQTDLLPASRFKPFNVTATATLTGQDLRSNMTIVVRNQPFASVAIRHSTATGAGVSAIDIEDATFVPARLQPGDISPLLGAFGTRVAGKANFAGKIAWDYRGELTSDGHLTMSDLGFDSPLGQVRQAKADVTFTSLVPIVAPAGQTFRAERIGSLVALESLAAKFSFTQEAIKLESSTATMAGGLIALDPLSYSFAPGAATAGTIHITDVNLAPVLAAAGLEMRVTTDAHVDGVVPFTSGPMGLRFKDGRVAANKAGRLGIKREALTAAIGTGAGAAAPPGAVQDFAYQAMENLAFDQLVGLVNSLPNGRLGMTFHIVGRHDPPNAGETRVGVFDLLRGHAFDKPLPLPKGTPIDLTLDTSLNLDELLAQYFAKPVS